jgi:hypothetical protein
MAKALPDRPRVTAAIAAAEFRAVMFISIWNEGDRDGDPEAAAPVPDQ